MHNRNGFSPDCGRVVNWKESMAATAEYFSYLVDDIAEDLPLLSTDNSVEPPDAKNSSPTFISGGYELVRGGPINILLVFVPCAIVSNIFSLPEGITFTLALLGLAPLAERLGFVTEQLTLHTNDSIGGLLNATFGNATELIVAASALFRGLNRLVQLSMLGSILSNMLLVLGSAFFLGGCRYKKQYFSKTSSQINSTLLILSCVGVLGPTILTMSSSESRLGELGYSRFASILLFLLYFAYLYFQLVSHKDLFESTAALPHSSNIDDRSGGSEKIASAPVTHDLSSAPTSPTHHDAVERSIPDEEWSSHSELQGSVDETTEGRRLPLNIHTSSKEQGLGLFKRENATPAPTPSKGPAYSALQIETSEAETVPTRRSGSSGMRSARFCRNLLCSMGHLQLCCGCCALVWTASTAHSATSNGSASRSHAREANSSDAFHGNPTPHEVDLLGFRYALLWLGVLTILISLLSDMVSSSIEEAAEDINMSSVFLAAIVLPIVGNAAEHASAISFALRNKMDVAIGVAVGSSTQIALCVLPLLVLLGWCGGCNMSLNFGAFESVTLMVSVVGVTFATKDGTSNWLLGLLLIAAYFIVAIGFYAHKNDSLK